MSHRRLLYALPAAALVAAAGLVLAQRDQSAPEPRVVGDPPGQPADLKPAVSACRSRQVILFNSGVGHFTRSGEVDGDARVDLTFPEQDVNDLIKSMTLRDLSPERPGGGRHVRQPRPDRPDPGQLRHQPEQLPQPGPDPDPGPRRAGRGDARQHGQPAGQPDRQDHGRRAAAGARRRTGDGPGVASSTCGVPRGCGRSSWATCSGCGSPTRSWRTRSGGPWRPWPCRHDAQKKAVSLHFAGEGKRKVEVGYVVENPIWKTSYRLVLGKDDGPKKPYLQGWAVVENPTDEDWAKVTMALVLGPADLVQDGPVQPAVRGPADGRARTVRLPAAADLRRGDESRGRSGRPSTAPAPTARREDGPPELLAEATRMPSLAGRRASGAPRRGGPEEQSPVRRRGGREAEAGPGPRPQRAERGDGQCPGGLLPVRDRPAGGPGPAEVGPPAHRQQGRGGQAGEHLQPGRPAQAPAARPAVQEHQRACPCPRGRSPCSRGRCTPGTPASWTCSRTRSGWSATPSTWAPKSSTKPGKNTSRITSVKAVKGIVTHHTVQREEVVYDVSNRSHDRPHPADRAPEPEGPGVRVHRASTSRRRRRPTCTGSRSRSGPRRT